MSKEDQKSNDTSEKPKSATTGEVLENGGGKNEPATLDSMKRRKKPRTRKRAHRSKDMPDCKTVDKCSTKSAGEASQSEWLNNIVSEPANSDCDGLCAKACNFLKAHKYSLIGGLAVAGLVVYFALKRGRKTCPFTGKSKFGK